MNIVVVSETNIEVYRSWHEMKKHTSFEKKDFTPLGTDYILNCTNETYEIVKDMKTLERVASQKVFSKDRFDATNWMQVFCLILLLLLYVG